MLASQTGRRRGIPRPEGHDDGTVLMAASLLPFRSTSFEPAGTGEADQGCTDALSNQRIACQSDEPEVEPLTVADEIVWAEGSHRRELLEFVELAV